MVHNTFVALGRLTFTLSLLAYLGPSQTYATAELLPKPGNYLGFIHMKDAPVKIPVSYDIVRIPLDDEHAAIRVYKRLMFGSFYSHEYVVQNYATEHYDWTNPVMDFDTNVGTNGPDMSLKHAAFDPADNTIKGEVRTVKGGAVNGTIQLVHTADKSAAELAMSTMFPGIPVMSSITGEYYSPNCNFEKSFLQLEAVKHNGAEFDTTNPFDLFQIIGRDGEANTNAYLPRAFRYMLRRGFLDGRFNYHKPSFSSDSTGLECDITPEGMECSDIYGGTCKYIKLGGRGSLSDLDQPLPDRQEAASSVVPIAGKTPGLKLAWPTNDSEVEGVFSGYIYIKQRRVYQPFGMELSLTGEPGKYASGTTRPELSALAKIYLCKELSRTGLAIPVKFLPMPLPGLSKTGKAPELLTLRGRDDALIQVTHWDEKGIGGHWYSRSFGHGGTFQMARHVKGRSTPAVQPPAPAEFERALTGTYIADFGKRRKDLGNDFDTLILRVKDKEGIDVSKSFPFELAGDYEISRFYPGGVARESYKIMGGSFDPFTGVVSIRVSNGRHLMGRMTSAGLALTETGSGVAPRTIIKEHSLREYKWISGYARSRQTR